MPRPSKFEIALRTLVESVKVKRPVERNAVELQTLVQLLSKQSMTARQVAKRMRCSKQTAHNRLKALSKTGCVLKKEPVRDGKTGPESIAYRVVLKPLDWKKHPVVRAFKR